MNRLRAKHDRRRNPNLEEILKNTPLAQETFEELSEKVGDEPLRRALEAVLRASPGRVRRLSGVSDIGKWLRKLRVDLLNIANRVEVANSSPYWSPEIASFYSKNAKSALRLKEYARLPEALRDYSRYISDSADIVQYLTPKGESPRTVAKLKLIQLVIENCGNPQYEKLSVLLYGVLNVSDRPLTKPESIEPDALRKLWDSNEKLRWLLFTAVAPRRTQLPSIPIRKLS